MLGLFTVVLHGLVFFWFAHQVGHVPDRIARVAPSALDAELINAPRPSPPPPVPPPQPVLVAPPVPEVTPVPVEPAAPPPGPDAGTPAATTSDPRRLH